MGQLSYTTAEIQGFLDSIGQISSLNTSEKSTLVAAINELKAALSSLPSGGETAGVTSFNGRTGAVLPSSGDYTAAMVGAAEASHTQSANTINSGTFLDTGVKAKDGTDYTVSRLRNIQAGTTDLTAGSSVLPSGSIYLVYE